MSLSDLFPPILWNDIQPQLKNANIITVADLYVAIAYETDDLGLTYAQKRRILENIVRPIREQLELSPELQERLLHRAAQKLPEFHRQEWFRYKKLGDMWRRPRGIHSKLRRQMGYRPPRVKIGFGTDHKVRNLHPSGYKLCYLSTVNELDQIDKRFQAGIIRSTVGERKRKLIEHAAITKHIYIINRKMISSMKRERL